MPVAPQWQEIDAHLTARGIQIGAPTIGQTTGGTHTAGSEHYEHRARDYGRSNSNVPAIVAELVPYAQGPAHVVDELFSTPENVFYADGHAITPSATLRAQHVDHVHVGMRAGAHFGTVIGGSSTTGDSSGIASGIATLTSETTFGRLVRFGAGVVFLGVGLVMAVRS